MGSVSCLEEREFLGVLARFRKATVSFLISVCHPSFSLPVCPSIHTEKIGSQWTDFYKIYT